VAQAHPLVDGFSFADGAALGVPFTTAYRALFHRAQARPGETVLVHGASGGVGTAAVQLARARGLRVIATAGTDEGLALVRDLGAHDVVSHREAGYEDRIRALTGGRGVDVIIEMLANVNLDRDLTLLAGRGRVAIVGNRGRIEIDPRQAMSRDAAIVGMALANTTPDEVREIHAAIIAGLANGTLKPIIREKLPLAEAPHAHERVLKAGAYGKIVLVP
jgi:NADPH2:quinone reductase